MEVSRAPVVPVEQDVIIRLSNREARVLYTILYNVGGNVNQEGMTTLRNSLARVGCSLLNADYRVTASKSNYLYVDIKE